MAEKKITNNRFSFFVNCSFYFLLLAYPLLSLLWRRSYPLFTVEVGTLFLLLLAFCILLTVILRKVRLTIVSLLLPLLITISFMLQFNLLLPGIILCIMVCVAVSWRLGTDFQLYALPVLITLILGAYFDSAEDDGRTRTASVLHSPDSELPPVVHILLDGFIGIEGLPPYQASALLKSEVLSFLDEYDFQVFTRAYSRYVATGDSLYSAMNFKHEDSSEYGVETLSRRQHVLSTNAEFDVMEELGYRLNIYQTSYIDFCQSNPDRLDRCWEYAQPNVLSINQVSSLAVKVRMLAFVLLRQSTILTDFAKFSGWLGVQLGVQGVAIHDSRVLTNLEEDIVKNPNGRFYFAHVLLPHEPFTFMHDCSINYLTPLWARYGSEKNGPIRSDEVTEIRTMKYFEQVECAVNSLRQLFGEMKRAGVFERSIIVIHGDHGSRNTKITPQFYNLGLLTPVDYRAHFSTLFAVKLPGQSGQVISDVIALGSLLEAFSKTVQGVVSNPVATVSLMQNMPTDPKKLDPYVYLTGQHPLLRVNINIFED